MMDEKPQRIDISDSLTDKFFADAKKGMVIGFKKDDVVTHYRIVRLNRQKKICIVEETRLMSPEDAAEQMRSDMTLEDVLKEFDGIGNSTTDVQDVLRFVGKPGEHRELKRQAVAKLFPATNVQQTSVADSIESYEEF